MVMDDLADRKHECDLLLDPSLGRTEDDYADLLPEEAVTLLGPQFALLRPEFAQLRAESLARRAAPQLRHLLITMGGVDKDNATGRVLDALDACALPNDARITVVMGPHAPWLAAVKERAEHMRRPTNVLTGVRDMARLMTDCDLAIGAAGSTSWERCCLGLPSFTLVLADNQKVMAATLAESGATLVMPNAEEAGDWFLSQVSAGTITNSLADMSAAAARLTDGDGASRVLRHIGDSHV
ncbi:MAG: UDP-2,4-diacetamido-2,4,6-trideoxy-beta-L-altropyranose hydrolase, partial [Sphingomonas sp.]